MGVTVHTRPRPTLTKDEIEAWRDVPVAVAADVVAEDQIDIGIRPINPPGK